MRETSINRPRRAAGWAACCLLLPLCALPALALDGIVLNGTTRRPQAGVEITLVQPGAKGMNQLGTATSGGDGKFKIDAIIPPGPGLIQASHSGVTYNQIITPGMPLNGVEVKVFDATKAAGIAKAAEHLILIEPTAERIKISETFVFLNETATTFNDPARGSARFFIPAASVDSARVVISAPGGMPITRPAIKTGDKNIYKADYPLKPGETRIDLTYAAPAGQKFAGKLPASDFSTHIVTPGSVKLTGDGIEMAGQEPQTQANIYNVTGLDYNLLIEGTGRLRTESAASPEEDTGQPKPAFVPARIDAVKWWIMGLTCSILALIGAMLYRRGVA